MISKRDTKIRKNAEKFVIELEKEYPTLFFEVNEVTFEDDKDE